MYGIAKAFLIDRTAPYVFHRQARADIMPSLCVKVIMIAIPMHAQQFQLRERKK